MDEEGNPTFLWINAKVTASQLFVHADFAKKAQKPIEEIVSKKFHKYLHLFKEETAAKFSPSWPFDHEIKLKEGFEPKVFKTYPLAPAVMTSASKSYLVAQSRPSSRVQESTSIGETESTTSSEFRVYHEYLDL